MKNIAPIIFYPWLGDPAYRDDWRKIEPFTGYLPEGPTRHYFDPEMKGKIRIWMVTPYWDMDLPPEQFASDTPKVYRALMKYLPGDFYLNVFSRIPGYLVGQPEKRFVPWHQGWDAEKHPGLPEKLQEYVAWLVETWGGRLKYFANGIEHSVAKLWPSGDVRSLIQEISRPIYEAVTDYTGPNKPKIIGYNDTINGDSVHHVDQNHSWKISIDKWAEAGGFDCCDVFGIHLYRRVTKSFDWPRIYETILAHVEREYGVSEIYVTETGFEAEILKKRLCGKGKHIVIEEKQAERWRQLVEYFEAEPSIQMLCPFCNWLPSYEWYLENGKEFTGNSALLRPDCTPRPAFNEIRKRWIKQ